MQMPHWTWNVIRTNFRASLPIALLVTSLVLTTAAASADTVQSVDDTYITTYGDPLGDADSTHGDATSLYSIFSPVPNLWETFPLVRFDLGAFAGQAVQGPATVSMYVQGTEFPVQYVREVSVHRVLIPWSGATVSFINFGPAPGVDLVTDVGDPLDTIAIEYPGTGNRYVTWTLPAALIQDWIDSPSSNYGLLIFNQSAGDLQFGSRESSNAPLLTLTIPEPSSLGSLALALAALIGRRMTRK
jgi:hypothetical protein